MVSVSGQIKKQILQGEEGEIYFVSDFYFPGYEDLVKKVLFRLEKNGILIRIAHGIYLYPVRDVKLGIMYPSMESIAQAIAQRDKADIMPTGALALNLLGISAQVQMNAVYITNGSPRKIQIGKRKIVFKKGTQKNFQFKSKIMPLIVSSLKEIGPEMINQQIILQIEKALSNRKEFVMYREDLSLVPTWMKKIIAPILNEMARE
jgi:hypothetical protein